MNDEVLVHISTAATGLNDERFRSLANAYINFAPHHIHREKPERKRARVAQMTPWLSNQSPTGARSEDQGPAIQCAPTASKESYGSFPSNIPAEGHCLEKDESLRPTSRLAQLERSYLSWRKHATPKSSFAQSEVEDRISSGGLDADTGFIEDSQSALQVLQSQLQYTYSTTSADTSEDEEAENHGGEDDDRAHPHSPAIHPNSPNMSHKIGSLEIEKPKERRLLAPLVENTLKDLDVSTPHGPKDLLDAPRPAFSDTLGEVSDETDFLELPVDAFPPAPKTSVARPGTLPSQVTKHLATMKAKNPTRFRPLTIRRDTSVMSSKSRADAGRAAGGLQHDDASDSDDYDLRPSAEHSDGDHDLLESEDERERLLTQREGISGLFGSGVKIGKRDGGRKKAEMTERKRGGTSGTSTPTYDTEEAAGESGASLLRSGRSSESDQQRLLATRAQKKA
ncbi:hypothetical protein N0V91_011047 [Didymella pomorum]|uniref:Uncharacterized protein n=1 Tax=Didymella pomorum TaxID=749634 RepID=A0A9W8Z2C1_9PLEO|nr:hypothetical protein N0V91_011047 [Didymella pomorum]